MSKMRDKLTTHENDLILTLGAVTMTLGLWQMVNVKPPALIDFIEVTEVDSDKIYSYMNKSMLMVAGIAGIFAMIHGRRGYYIPSLAALGVGAAMYLWTDAELRAKRGILY